MSKRRSRRTKINQPGPAGNVLSADKALAGAVLTCNTAACNASGDNTGVEDAYRQAAGLAEMGDFNQARSAYRGGSASQTAPATVLGGAVENDIGTLHVHGRRDSCGADAIRSCTRNGCRLQRWPSAQNLAILNDDEPPPVATAISNSGNRPAEPAPIRRARVAILSTLFNWPSTGGGTVHTAETGKFLSRAGYDVKHFYAQFAGWGVGNVTLPAPTIPPKPWHSQRPTGTPPRNPAPVPRGGRPVRPRLRHHHRQLELQAAPCRSGPRLSLFPAAGGPGMPVSAEQRAAAR